MNNLLIILFDFLKENRIYNSNLQRRACKNMLAGHNNSFEKVTSLMYHVANTQARPRIDKLSDFFRTVYSNKECLTSFNQFVRFLVKSEEASFELLYQGLRTQSGWGDKTAALFVKYIHLIHNRYKTDELLIWNDVPETIKDFIIPVDTVIINIFKKIDPGTNWDFHKINKYLKKEYNSNNLEIWDDLWFWGFLNQRGSGYEREFGWNESKYWIMHESDKSIRVINEVKEKSKEFVEILNSKIPQQSLKQNQNERGKI